MIILKVAAFILASWILVHLLVFFGAFLALAYPLWWFLELKRFPCLWCRIKEAEKCTFSHSFLDAGLILVFTALSVGLVFAESKILFRMGFPPTPKTVSFVIPPKGQYRLGEIFSMPIEIVGVKKPINAVQADISFDPRRIEAVEVSIKDSFANIFVQKEVDNEIGFTRLTGGLPNPGFFSDHGLLGTVYFRGKTPGVTKIEFLPSSLVLANDGRGTNVLKEITSASYLILPDKLSPEEEKQQEVILAPVVLGEQTVGQSPEGQTQMIFYEEKKILGTEISQEIEKGRKFYLGRTLLGLLEKVDRFILSLWGRILNRSSM